MRIIIRVLNAFLLILFFSSMIYLTFFNAILTYDCIAITICFSTSISVAIYVLNKIK
jgi:hypothetical protein